MFNSPPDNRSTMPTSPTFLHRTHRPWGMVLAVLALCMQLWKPATAAHFGQAVIQWHVAQ